MITPGGNRKRLEKSTWKASCLEGNSVIAYPPPQRYFRRTVTIQITKPYIALVRISTSMKPRCTRSRQHPQLPSSLHATGKATLLQCSVPPGCGMCGKEEIRGNVYLSCKKGSIEIDKCQGWIAYFSRKLFLSLNSSLMLS